MFDILLICVAGFLAGALNAVAGGGTFITFPALVFLGVPTITANATATLAALPGYVSSAYAYRHDLQAEGALSFRATVVVAIIAGLAGAGLLIVTSDAAFSFVVPWLLLLATVLFAAGPALTGWLKSRGLPPAGPVLSAGTIAAVSVYGGYFNGGLGIMLLAAFGLLGHTNLHAMNGMKNILSVVLSLTSVVAFVAAGLIDWQTGVPMAAACTVGGFVAAHFSRRITNTQGLRWFVIAVGAVMTVLFFLR